MTGSDWPPFETALLDPTRTSHGCAYESTSPLSVPTLPQRLICIKVRSAHCDHSPPKVRDLFCHSSSGGVCRHDPALARSGHINDPGGIRRQFHHVIDIAPTILEAAGIAQPETVNGIKQSPMEGVSLAYTWDKANANAPTRHTTQYFEMLGNRAIVHDGWMASTTPVTLPWALSSDPPPDVVTGYKWELYNLQEDPTQFNDLAAQMPEKVKEMQAIFDSEAKKYNVLPLDNTTIPRWNTPRPSLTAGRTVFTYSGELTGVPDSAAPNIINKSYTITAEVEIPKGGAEGMIVTEGGRFGGYGLFLSKGVAGVRASKPVFLYNLLNLKRTIWSGPELGAGKHTIIFDFKSDGPGLGKGGTGVLSVDGKEVDRKSMEHTTPVTFAEDESFDHPHWGRDAGVSLRCSVQVHRQDQQADFQARTGEGSTGPQGGTGAHGSAGAGSY
jgi:hypothetical protein